MTLHIESAKHGHQNRKCFILETAQLNEKVKLEKKRHTGIISWQIESKIKKSTDITIYRC